MGVLAIGSFFRDLNCLTNMLVHHLNCLTNMLVHHLPKLNILNDATNNPISYGGCHTLLLCTRDAMSGGFLGFKCFRVLLNFLNSENSLLSRILFGLFPLMSCLLCEPTCHVLIPAGMLQCSLISRVRKFIVPATVKQPETL